MLIADSSERSRSAARGLDVACTRLLAAVLPVAARMARRELRLARSAA